MLSGCFPGFKNDGFFFGIEARAVLTITSYLVRENAGAIRYSNIDANILTFTEQATSQALTLINRLNYLHAVASFTIV